MVFPVVMHGCESWIIKKAECRRIDDFELWCWIRLLRVPWTARRSNQSILKEISPDYSLEGLMLKLKLQSIGHLMQRTDSLEKTLMLGKTEGRRRRGQERMSIYILNWVYIHIYFIYIYIMKYSVQSLNCVQVFVTPWTAASHVSLSITNSRTYSNLLNLLKLISIESVMPSNHILHFLYPFLWWTFMLLHVLAIVNSASVNTGLHVSFWIMVFLGYMLDVISY